MISRQFTQRADEALASAHELAVNVGSPALEPLHLVRAMKQQPMGLIASLAQAG